MTNQGHATHASRPAINRLRDALGLRWFVLKWRAKRRWTQAVAPHKLHPESLYGNDGEPPYFVRRDLAATPDDAAVWLAKDSGMPIAEFAEGMDPIEDIHPVWMVEHVNICTCPEPRDPDWPDDDCDGHRDDESWYDVVSPFDMPPRGAVEYWRWDW